MTPESIFYTTCAIAAAGWIIIVLLSPFWIGYDKFMVGIIIALLAICYAWLGFSYDLPGRLQDFTSFRGLREMFSQDYVLTAAWVHLLAFDLLAAVWIKRNSVMHNIGHAVIIPALVFTCIFGPLGFIIYLLTRWIKTKKYFAENFN